MFQKNLQTVGDAKAAVTNMIGEISDERERVTGNYISLDVCKRALKSRLGKVLARTLKFNAD